MALTSDSSATLTGLLALVKKDLPLCAAIRDACDRLTSGDDRTAIMRVVPRGYSVGVDGDADTALDALIADVESNS